MTYSLRIFRETAHELHAISIALTNKRETPVCEIFNDSQITERLLPLMERVVLLAENVFKEQQEPSLKQAILNFSAVLQSRETSCAKAGKTAGELKDLCLLIGERIFRSEERERREDLKTIKRFFSDGKTIDTLKPNEHQNQINSRKQLHRRIIENFPITLMFFQTILSEVKQGMWGSNLMEQMMFYDPVFFEKVQILAIAKVFLRSKNHEHFLEQSVEIYRELIKKITPEEFNLIKTEIEQNPIRIVDMPESSSGVIRRLKILANEVYYQNLYEVNEMISCYLREDLAGKNLKKLSQIMDRLNAPYFYRVFLRALKEKNEQVIKAVESCQIWQKLSVENCRHILIMASAQGDIEIFEFLESKELLEQISIDSMKDILLSAARSGKEAIYDFLLTRYNPMWKLLHNNYRLFTNCFLKSGHPQLLYWAQSHCFIAQNFQKQDYIDLYCAAMALNDSQAAIFFDKELQMFQRLDKEDLTLLWEKGLENDNLFLLENLLRQPLEPNQIKNGIYLAINMGCKKTVAWLKEFHPEQTALLESCELEEIFMDFFYDKPHLAQWLAENFEDRISDEFIIKTVCSAIFDNQKSSLRAILQADHLNKRVSRLLIDNRRQFCDEAQLSGNTALANFFKKLK